MRNVAPPSHLNLGLPPSFLKRFALLTLGWGLLPCSFATAQQPAQQPPARQEPSSTLKVDVKLVNVFATVTDSHGSPVAGLTKENFAIQEDGHDQKIAIFDKQSAVPLSIA